MTTFYSISICVRRSVTLLFCYIGNHLLIIHGLRNKSRPYELSLGTSFAKVDRLGAENGCCRQTDRHYGNLYIDNTELFSIQALFINGLFDSIYL